MSKPRPGDHRVQLTFSQEGDGELYDLVDKLFAQVSKKKRSDRLKQLILKSFLSPARSGGSIESVEPLRKRDKSPPVPASNASVTLKDNPSGAQVQLNGMNIDFDTFSY